MNFREDTIYYITILEHFLIIQTQLLLFSFVVLHICPIIQQSMLKIKAALQILRKSYADNHN